jgi:hypothetical protein
MVRHSTPDSGHQHLMNQTSLKKFLFDTEENSTGYGEDILTKMLPLVSPGYSMLTEMLLSADDHNRPNITTFD